MGSPQDEVGRNSDEMRHRVDLTQGFWLGVHPVTQAQWEAITGRNPSSWEGQSRPVETVSWDDCQALCQTLSERTLKQVRLPGEAEWEFACRAGSTPSYHTGDGATAMSRTGCCGGQSQG